MTDFADKLASSRETTHGAVLDVCERVNASKSGEAVGREAARTIRKILKNGTDAERRMALRIWWITMRNINVRGYRRECFTESLCSPERLCDESEIYGRR